MRRECRDELFGVKQQFIQFTPDLLEDLEVSMDAGYHIRGGVYLQSYFPTSGTPVGRFNDGRVAVVDNTFGKGRTRLVGTFPGYAYAKRPDDDTKRFFADLLPWARKKQHISSSNERIIVRLHAAQEARYLWIVNANRQASHTEITLSDSWGPIVLARSSSGISEVDSV